jgi:trimeric autotransporter adhesin
MAKWDGSTWTALGTGMNAQVNALAMDSSGHLYAGGSFTLAGGAANTSRVAMWDGTSWSALGTGSTGGNGTVNALALDSSGNLYAGGSFSAAGGVANTSYIAKWTPGSPGTWSDLDTGVTNSVNALAVDSSGNLYAGGAFTRAGGATTVFPSYVAKWKPTTATWSTVSSGMSSTVSALAFDSSSGNLYAGGVFATAGGFTAAYVAKWSGTAWSALGAGMDNTVSALTFDSSGCLYAGGSFTSAGGVANTKYVAKWNPTTSAWSALGTGANNTVSALAMDKTSTGCTGGATCLYAGGSFTLAGGVANTSRVAKWDGTAWSALGAGMNSGTVSALALDKTSTGCTGGATCLYAGGSFTLAGGVTVNKIAKWDGTSWSALGAGMDGTVSALALDNTSTGCTTSPCVYAGGAFTTAGGVTVNKIAKWDGTSWSALGAGMNGTVSALALDSSGLYAGGSFTSANGVAVNNVAQWNGTTWSALGTGVSSSGTPQVNALAKDASGNIYAVGNFTTAGGLLRPYIAKWISAFGAWF